jgi:hypothetical protein
MFNVGDFVRSYDFEPSEGREPQYVEGLIIKVDFDLSVYVIQVKACTYGDRVGGQIRTPIKTWDDYEGRIQKVIS